MQNFTLFSKTCDTKTVTWNFLFPCKHILHCFVISWIVASKQTNKEIGVQKYAYVTNGTELNFIKCNQIIFQFRYLCLLVQPTKVFSRNIMNGLNHKTDFLKGFSKRSRAIIFFPWFVSKFTLKIPVEMFCIFNYETVFTLQWKQFFWTTVFINKLSHWKPFSSCWTAKIFTKCLESLL